MSVFGSIMSKLFGTGAQAQTPPPSSASPSPSTPATSPASQPAAGAAPNTGATTQGSPATSSVDVAAIMDEHVAKSGQTLDWRHSIVDMMKALGLDSSLAARKALAQELHYTGNTADSAAMNMWLHKQVMRKLAENGGKVPDDLRD